MLILFLDGPSVGRSVVKRPVLYSAETFCLRGTQRAVFMSAALSSTDNTVSINWDRLNPVKHLYELVAIKFISE